MIKRFRQFLDEDVEPQIFARAIWVVGRPGSGKSMFANLIKKSFPSLQVIDSDRQFEALLKKAGIDKDLRGVDSDPEKQKEVNGLRNKAIRLSKKRWDTLTGLRSTGSGDYNDDLGFIYVGTGASVDWLEKKIEEFRAWGFKPFIVYVNTPADVAKERNASRDRKVDDKVIDKFDSDHEGNVVSDRANPLKNIVGERNFIELVNDSKLNDEQAINKKFPALLPRLKKFLGSRK
jgi:predicted kinase